MPSTLFAQWSLLPSGRVRTNKAQSVLAQFESPPQETLFCRT